MGFDNPNKTTNSGAEPKLPPTAAVPDDAKLPDGQNVDHWILDDAERAKGFVRPVRVSYVHEKCGAVTSMPLKIAETYARDPKFYGRTFCASCGDYFPVGSDGEFVWKGTSEKVGT